MEAPEHLHLHGDYEVGVRMLELSYQPPGQEEERTLPVIVWHPTDNVEGLRREPVKMAKIISLSKKRYRNAELAQGAPRPVLVHSNGAGGEASLAYRTAEVFASRGWVVASISHVGNTTLDALGDPLDVPMYIPVYCMLDVQTVLDAAEEGFGFEGFAEQVDVDNTVVYGHSFGGYTSLALGGAAVLRDGAKQMVCEEDVECEDGDILCGQHNEEACAFLDDEEIVEVTEQGLSG